MEEGLHLSQEELDWAEMGVILGTGGVMLLNLHCRAQPRLPA